MRSKSPKKGNKRTWAVMGLLIIFSFYFLISACSVVAAAEGGEFSSEICIPIGITIEPGAGVSIYPDHTGEGSPGKELNYLHTVENKGNIPDTFNITYTSTLRWEYKFFTDPNGDGNPSDGVELIDTNGDGIIDTGEIGKNCDRNVVKQVTIPEGAASGQVDTMIITATSILDSAPKQEYKGQDNAKNITTVIPPHEIFGKPEPIPAPLEMGVLPFTGAVLLPIFICGWILLGSGMSLSRRRKMRSLVEFFKRFI